MVNLVVRKLELTDAVILAEIDILLAVGILVGNITSSNFQRTGNNVNK